MLEITEERQGSTLTICPEGQMNLTTSPAVAEKLTAEKLAGVEQLIFDLEKLEYLSSAGLRVFLAATKTMAGQGEIIIRNAGQEIHDIFELAGFANIMTIE
ncbi:MAG: STAS domain-containing protein [Eubacterium sp.]|nr:STAS domain-containing protein [Eubacterium sp.]